MKVSVNNLPKRRAEMTVELDVMEMKPFLEKAATKISEKIKIPGFRPGKAPYEIVRQAAGEMTILEEACDLAVNQTYFKALDEAKLEAVGRPRIEIQKMAPNNPLVYKAIVSLWPKLKLPNCKKIKVEKEKVKIAPDKMEKVLNDLRGMRGQEKPVERAIQKGDKAEADWEMYLDKVLLEDGQVKNAQILMDESFYIPGFADNLIGLKKGETKDFPLKFPDNYFNKNLANRTVDFKVKINAVYQIDLPELDDSFAKSLGKFESLAELKNQIQTNLEEEAKMKAEQKAELKMLEEIVEKTEFEDIPEPLIESEAHKMVHELEDNILNQGLKFEDYLTHLKKTEEDLEKELRPQAEKRVKTSLMIQEVAKEEKITVGMEEVEQEIAKALGQYKDYPEIMENIQSPAYKEYLENLLLNRKAIELLKTMIIK